jgi:sulfonate transport system permease protein
MSETAQTRAGSPGIGGARPRPRSPGGAAAAAGLLPDAVRGPALGLIVPAAILAAWQIGSATGLFAAHLVPSPYAVWDELAYLHGRGELFEHIAVTFQRVVIGFGTGVLAASVLGALTGASRTARALLDPTLQGLKAVPSLAWVPLFILWFGIFEASKIALIAVGVFFPIYLNLSVGIRQVDRKLVEVGRICRLSRLQLIRRILIPATLPSYFVGLRAGLALGWMFVIAAELMGASQGLGFLMLDGQMTGRPAIIVGALILFAIAGKLSDILLVAAGRRVLAWQDAHDTGPAAEGR